MQKVKDKPVTDIAEEPIKASKWVRMHFLKDGRSGFGEQVVDTEEEATALPPINGYGFSINDAPPLQVFRIFTMPAMRGEEILHLGKDWSHHIPYPLL